MVENSVHVPQIYLVEKPETARQYAICRGAKCIDRSTMARRREEGGKRRCDGGVEEWRASGKQQRRVAARNTFHLQPAIKKHSAGVAPAGTKAYACMYRGTSRS